MFCREETWVLRSRVFPFVCFLLYSKRKVTDKCDGLPIFVFVLLKPFEILKVSINFADRLKNKIMVEGNWVGGKMLIMSRLRM